MRLLLLLPAVLSILSACSVEPVQPTAPDLDESVFQEGAPEVDSDWWTAFDDAQLNQWIEQGLRQNQDLVATYYRLKQSEASWDASGAGYFPTLNASLEKSQTESETGNVKTSSDSWSAGLSASYELDFWGNIAAQKDKGEFQYLASTANVRIMSNTVAGEISKAWYGWLLEEKKRALLNTQEQRIRSTLKAVEGRYARGKVTVSDIWQQKQLLESLQGDLAQTQARLEIYRQTLALWLSIPSNQLPDVAIGFLPKNLSSITSVSSDTLQTRPDVQKAYYELQVANAGLAVAKSNRYPRFTLTASYTGSNENFSSVFDDWVSNFVGGLFLPIVDGGSRRAEVRRSEALLNEEVADYKQVLLKAAQEVEQIMVNERQQRLYVDSLKKQLELAEKTQGFQERRYRKGIGDFINMIEAQQNVLTLERQVLDARWQQTQYRIQLYRALAQGVSADALAMGSEHE